MLVTINTLSLRESLTSSQPYPAPCIAAASLAMSTPSSSSSRSVAPPDPLDFLDSPEMKAILAAKAASFPTHAADIDQFLEAMPLMTTRTPLADEERSADLAAVEALAGEERTEDRVEAFKQSGNEAYKLATALSTDADKNEAQLALLQQQLAALTATTAAAASTQPAASTEEVQRLEKEIDRLRDKIARQRSQHDKKLRDACIYYSQAIDLHTFLPLLASSCYANRSLVQLQLHNYRSALEDAREAVKLDRNSSKAWWRGATALRRIGKLAMAAEWVASGLGCRHIGRGEKEALLRLGREVEEEQRKEKEKEREREERQRKEQVEQEAKRREEAKETDKVVAALKERGLKLGAPLFSTNEQKEDDDSNTTSSTPSLPTISPLASSSSPYGGRIQLLDDGSLSFPLLFLYPQHQQSDYIQSHHELEPLSTALALLFLPTAPSPPWDTHGLYRTDELQVWLEWEAVDGSGGGGGRVRVDAALNLLSVLSMPVLRKKQYRIPGVPTFVVEPAAHRSNAVQ